VDAEDPCVNKISPVKITNGAMEQLGLSYEGREWKECIPKISGYTHVLNPSEQGFPFMQSIRSMLGFCDEVVVVDGGSKDGSLEDLKSLAAQDPRLQVYEREWDPEEPGMDGMQKAYGRAMCTGDLLWQQDADEVVHEDDYARVRALARRFPAGSDIVHLPVIELWGDDHTVRTDRHAWKWRMSRNDYRITHGINSAARVVDEKTGRTYAKRGMSDGCEYIDVLKGEHLPHTGFWTGELEELRQRDPQEYGRRMNDEFDRLPCVFHYSWADLSRKVRNFRDFWDRTWSRLYNDSEPVRRFPGVDTDEQVAAAAAELKERGGEHAAAQTFPLRRRPPALMEGWPGV
jgi:glycosyltransferase involved in cell wall biosynthesis